MHGVYFPFSNVPIVVDNLRRNDEFLERIWIGREVYQRSNVSRFQRCPRTPGRLIEQIGKFVDFRRSKTKTRTIRTYFGTSTPPTGTLWKCNYTRYPRNGNGDSSLHYLYTVFVTLANIYVSHEHAYIYTLVHDRIQVSLPSVLSRRNFWNSTASTSEWETNVSDPKILYPLPPIYIYICRPGLY